MDILPTVDTYEHDTAAQNIWERLKSIVGALDGICYYKHPIIESATKNSPDIALIAEGFHPLTIKILACALEDIGEVSKESWQISGASIDSPIFELDDYVISLNSKWEKQRLLRRRLDTVGVLVLPLITKADFEAAHGAPSNLMDDASKQMHIYFRDSDITKALHKLELPLGEREWLLTKSVFQGANPLNKQIIDVSDKVVKIGNAISILETQIALLDDQQHKVAIQMAPGPQRIRGLAGTGKTVILAMKVANIHRRYPDMHILFSFHTQSLYNQSKKLITRFYREYSDSDPNWDKLHIMHGWGSQNRPGVYSELCKRLGLKPLTLANARTLDSENPFRACCKAVLEHEFEPFYDFILVDEAQDFPAEYFLLLAKLISEHKRIYFAYDELQSLTNVEMPKPEDLFGKDEKNEPFISLEGDDYPGGIEKDFVLHRSYRCALEVLMLAHGIGLGIHGPKGCVQMLGNMASWESIGYTREKGSFNTGDETIFKRPKVNSPNRVHQIYKGEKPLIEVQHFTDRPAEYDWVANSMQELVEQENVRPEDIIVICLDSRKSRNHLLAIQSRLDKMGIWSTIPGLIDKSWKFAEPGMATLTTVYRAKGNEAPVVFICSFDSLYSYAEEVESRNRAFTSLSRSKGWIRITGIGPNMKSAQNEIEQIRKDIPYFRFKFPDMNNIRIRKLDASETSRRRKEVGKARTSVKTLINLEKDAIKDLDPELLGQLRDILGKADGEDY